MEIRQYAYLDSAWLKAAVTGSLWASVEIVAGSFLHNLQVPFSGTILTAFSIFLLSAFSLLWKEKGVIWRAGVICALMKSISPSAIIIGPMVGILSEALLFEMILVVTGFNLAGIIAAGAITSLTAILHKFFTLLILYGFDFVRILESLYHFAVKQLQLTGVSGSDLLLVLASVYMAAGVVAATAGYWIAVDFLRNRKPVEFSPQMNMSRQPGYPGTDDRQEYSMVLIAVHLLVMTGLLWLLNLDYLLSVIALSVVYLVYCTLKYPMALRRLVKIAVWLQFVFIVASTVILWDIFQVDHPGAVSGWMTGLKMVVRAILVITGFAVISVELRNPFVRTILHERGFTGLYRSLTMAFGVLPDLVASFSRGGLTILNPVTLTRQLLRQAGELTDLFMLEQKRLPALFIVTGGVGSGKTTFARQLVALMGEKGYRAGGFLAPGIDMDGRREGFRLEALDTGEKVLLCTTDATDGWNRTGRYYFNPEAITFGNRVLETSRLTGADFVVVDEVGHMELASRGWAAALTRMVAELPVPQVWVARESLAGRVSHHWYTGDVCLLSVSDDSPESAAAILSSRIGKNQ